MPWPAARTRSASCLTSWDLRLCRCRRARQPTWRGSNLTSCLRARVRLTEPIPAGKVGQSTTPLPFMPKAPKVSPPPIERQIHLIRGQKVTLDADLAALYEVPTRVLNQAVRRNLDRFPGDFMFQLSGQEAALLRSQIVILEKGRGKYPKYAPHVFTEHGVAMLAGILRSERAVAMSITSEELR